MNGRKANCGLLFILSLLFLALVYAAWDRNRWAKAYGAEYAAHALARVRLSYTLDLLKDQADAFAKAQWARGVVDAAIGACRVACPSSEGPFCQWMKRFPLGLNEMESGSRRVLAAICEENAGTMSVGKGRR